MDIANNLIDGVFDLLIADSGVSGALGGRIFYELAPQKAVGPYAVMSLLDTNMHLLDGGYAVQGELQISIYDLPTAGPNSLRTIANEIYDVLNGSSFSASGVDGAIICQEDGMMRSSITLNEEYLQCTSLYRLGGQV